MRYFSVFLIVILSAIVADAAIYHTRRTKRVNSRIKADSGQFTKWFTQKLDHFNGANTATWQQRYFVNDQFFDKNKRNVAFFTIGGEDEIDENWMLTGEWVDNAQRFNAILFNLEHRFYGQSRPTKDTSVQNLQYLTSGQALADLAAFITAMNKQYNLSPDVKWIVFGESYSGALAAWAKLKYPQLIQGAVSTSAPLLAKPNFLEYYQVVANDLRNINQNCYNAVQAAFVQIDSLIQNVAGQKSLTSKFQLCDPLEQNLYDDYIASFYSSLAIPFGDVAQYNKVNLADSSSRMTLDKTCAIMTNSSQPKEIDRLATFNKLMNQANGQSCTNGFQYSYPLAALKDTSWGDGERQWIFQMCNEFGFFQTSDATPQIFGNKFTLDFSEEICADSYGQKYDRSYIEAAARRTNSLYGGVNINVDNVAFVHGSVDPWHKLGITKTVNPKSPAIFIQGTAHVANTYPPRDEDLPQLKAARVQITKLIQTWLGL